MQRYRILLSAIAMQLCLGATYSWSVYVRPIRDITGLSQATLQLPFTVFYFAFPATVIFSGLFLSRLGPSRSAAAGGFLFGTGWLIASLGSHHFAITVLGIGLLAGTGVGLAYVAPLAVLVQWFPRQKGLVTGLAVAGFGGGAALIGQIGGRLIASHGFSPYSVFALFGGVFLVVATSAGFSMKYPPAEQQQTAELLPFRSILLQKEFRLLYGAMIIALAAGFTVNANMKDLFLQGGTATGILAVSLFALANAIGRLVWGAMFDRLTSSGAVRTNLIAQAVVLGASPWLLRTEEGFLLLALGAGFNYGGVLVLYASTVTRVWGAGRVGQVYGFLFSANILAAPAPLLAAMLYDSIHTFVPGLIVVALLLLIAALFVMMRSPVIDVHPPESASPRV
jgi:OFA family oxalate/formate antiporter-like MFS transporter